MNKYRIKVNECGEFSLSYKKSKKSIFTFWKESDILDRIIFPYMIMEWLIHITEIVEWKNISYYDDNKNSSKFNEEIYISVWYETEEEVHELMERHKEETHKIDSKFEKVIFKG